MMLLTLLLLQSGVLASTSKGMVHAPSVCNIKFSSCSVYKTTGSYALSCVPEDMQRKTSHWDELSSKSCAQAMEGSFLHLCAAAVTKLLVRAGWCALSKLAAQLLWRAESPWHQWRFKHLSQHRSSANRLIPLQGWSSVWSNQICTNFSSLTTAIIEGKILIYYPAIWYIVSEGQEPAKVPV